MIDQAIDHEFSPKIEQTIKFGQKGCQSGQKGCQSSCGGGLTLATSFLGGIDHQIWPSLAKTIQNLAKTIQNLAKTVQKLAKKFQK
jgi:hypothetical protein